MTVPSVSVVIPTYNSAALVPQAIDSVLAQTVPVREILVLDDGSTDDTAQRVACYPAPVRYLRSPNQGVSATRNRGLREATGELIAFLDADDVWHPRKLDFQLHVLVDNPQLALLGTSTFEWPAPVYPEVNASSPQTFCLIEWPSLAVKNYFTTSSIVVRRKVLERVGPFDTALQGPEDFDLWLRIGAIAPVANLKLPLTGYRTATTNSLSKQARTMQDGMLRILQKLDKNNLWHGNWLLRQKAYSYCDYSCGYMYAAAGARVHALGNLLRSLARYPLPYKRSEVRMSFARLKLLRTTMWWMMRGTGIVALAVVTLFILGMGGIVGWRWHANNLQEPDATRPSSRLLAQVGQRIPSHPAKKPEPSEDPIKPSLVAMPSTDALKPVAQENHPKPPSHGSEKPLPAIKKAPRSPEPLETMRREGPDSPILLSPQVLTALRKKAAAKSPQWKAFQARLDGALAAVFRDAYQGSQLAWISDYSLGYLVLKDRDPATASKYADKTIVLIKSGLHDYQKGGWEARQFLARGDGIRKTFTLPHRDILRSSMRVYLAKVSTAPIKRGPGTNDPVEYYRIYLKVSNTADSPADYKEGTDWRRSPDLPNNVIDWTLPGKKPTPGGIYYVTSTSGFGATNTAFTLNGNTIALPTAPAADQAILVEYIYGKHAPDHSTLAYQQTSAGDGGFSSILVDTTYSSRYLGKHIAMGLDWLADYPGLSPSLRKEAMDLLVRWSDFTRDQGYMKNSPASNYEAGAYVSRVMTALALAKRHPDGPRLLKEVLTYRQKYLLPTLENERSSLKGGFWAEGWSYGQLAVQNLLLAGLALETSGLIPAATAERRWSGEVIRHLVSAQSSLATVYDGGDWFAYPAPFPGKELFYLLAAMADRQEQSYANYILQKYPGRDSSSYIDLLFRQPTASPSFWSSLPLQHYASGTGLLTARSDWGHSPIWMAFQMGNLLGADHQSYSPGQLQIKRGDDDLLINGNAPGKNQAGGFKSTYGNLIVVDDNGEKKQVYRWSMGIWYGTPGVVVNVYEASKDHVYLSGDYRAAYSLNTAPGRGGSVRELTRQVVYLRPNHIIVYDRVATLKDSYPKQLRWHFLKSPQIRDNSFIATVGKSKLFGRTFSSIPLATTCAAVKVGDATVQQVITQNTNPTEQVHFVSVLQVAPSKASSSDDAHHITSIDSFLEGAHVSDRVILFGRDGEVPAGKSITYETSTAKPCRHFLTDLPRGRKYQIKVGETVRETATTSDQGTLSFTTPETGKQTVEVIPVA